MTKVSVMIAGIGGASLGTEILKALSLVPGYEIHGGDVSPTAYGLYSPGFSSTTLLSRDNYVDQVLTACVERKVRVVIPGGEQPMSLLAAAADRFVAAGIRLLGNSPEVVALCSDKEKTFQRLAAAGVSMPRTTAVNSAADLLHVGLPCIVKPATGSGGSANVFFAVTVDEAVTYAEFIRRSGAMPIAQEYVADSEGEYSIGVLSLSDGELVGSIALRRSLDAKLSVAYRGRGGVVSSGYSQGHIGHYPELCRQAEAIALAVGSRGPINVQARVRQGVLMPFEINPRFSASTYLRAMAGFNEIDMLIQHALSGSVPTMPQVRSGWYLRSLTEQFVPEGKVKT